MSPIRRQNSTRIQNDFSVEPELNQRPMDIFLDFIESLILQSTALPTELSTDEIVHNNFNVITFAVV